jgi:hypothetical protein
MGADSGLTLTDLLYGTLAHTSYPGYGFMLASGATSLYEHWDTLWELVSHFLPVPNGVPYTTCVRLELFQPRVAG